MATLILQGTGYQPTQQQEAEAVDFATRLFCDHDLTLEMISREWENASTWSEEIERVWDAAQNNAMRICGTDRVALVIS